MTGYINVQCEGGAWGGLCPPHAPLQNHIINVMPNLFRHLNQFLSDKIDIFKINAHPP